MTEQIKRCTGHCCKNFTLPLSPMELEFHKKRLSVTNKYKYLEIDKIADMVIFLYSDRKYIHDNNKTDNGSEIAYHYTCKHFNKELKVCNNYQNRPEMCRSYSKYGDCKYKKCTQKMKRCSLEKKVTDEKAY